MENDFGVGLGPEDMTEVLELGPKISEIVNLAVECEPDRAVFIGHRLPARFGKIDDGEAPVSETRGTVKVGAGAVRPSMGQHVGHRRQRVETGRRPVEIEDAGNAAHYSNRSNLSCEI